MLSVGLVGFVCLFVTLFVLFGFGFGLGVRREGERELLVGAGMVLRHLQDSGIALFLIQKEKGESLNNQITVLDRSSVLFCRYT